MSGYIVGTRLVLLAGVFEPPRPEVRKAKKEPQRQVTPEESLAKERARKARWLAANRDLHNMRRRLRRAGCLP